MSRSRKRVPIAGIAAETDKPSKRWWNRAFRLRARRLIAGSDDFDGLTLPMDMRKETEYRAGGKEAKIWQPNWPKAFRK